MGRSVFLVLRIYAATTWVPKGVPKFVEGVATTLFIHATAWLGLPIRRQSGLIFFVRFFCPAHLCRDNLGSQRYSQVCRGCCNNVIYSCDCLARPSNSEAIWAYFFCAFFFFVFFFFVQPVGHKLWFRVCRG